MRIAVIGGGISGLVAAYCLADDHALTLFEANDYLGGHTNTVRVDLGDEQHQVDTGFIVFNNRTYPKFTALLAELGIAAKPTIMSFSVRNDEADLEYNGHSLAMLFAQKRNLVRPWFYRMLTDIVRFNRLASTEDHGDLEGQSVREFVAQHQFSQVFVEQYLLPMGSAIWSCPLRCFADFPISFVVSFFRNHGLLSLRDRPTWYVVEGGSQAYVRAMTKKFAPAVRLNAPIASVTRSSEGVQVRTRAGQCEDFDHVIFACHSDQTLRILGEGATALERSVLSSFPYVSSEALLHTDTSILPKRRSAWASWNYRTGGSEANPPVVTYNMNILQGLKSRHTFCVTLNAESQIDPKRVLGRYVYEHPTFDSRRAAAQARHPELVDANRSSFCGAYWRNGFHEDGVVSALSVVAAIRGRSSALRLPAKEPVTAHSAHRAPVDGRTAFR